MEPHNYRWWPWARVWRVQHTLCLVAGLVLVFCHLTRVQLTVDTWLWCRLNSLALRRRLAMLSAILTPWVGSVVGAEVVFGL